ALLLSTPVHPAALPSFPTRRSSDLRLVLVDTRQADGELDAQAEALTFLADAHLCVDDGVRRVDAHLLAGQPQGTLEAGAVADGEQLLRVRAAAGATPLPGCPQVALESLGVGGAVPVTASRDFRARRVSDVLRGVHVVSSSSNGSEWVVEQGTPQRG